MAIHNVGIVGKHS